MQDGNPLFVSEWTDLRLRYADLLTSGESIAQDAMIDISRGFVDSGFPIFEFDRLHDELTQGLAWFESDARQAQAVRAQILETYDRALSGLRKVEKKYRKEVLDQRQTSKTLSRTAESLAASRENYRSEVMVQQRQLREKAKELERLNDKIIAQRDELRGFLYAISHDLKTPANTVVTLLNQFLEDHEGAEIDRLDIEDAQATTERMRKMLDDLLNFSRTLDAVPENETVDLNTLVADIISDLSGGRETHLIFKKDRLPEVTGSVFQLRLLFQNLIANGAKFCRPDRTPVVEIQNKGPRGLTHYAIAIVDNGIGIAPVYHDRIFELFNRLHTYADYPGTGIGLSLCRRVVMNHKAQLHLKSVPGEGSTFTVVLPL